jgi:hypothetical protein
VNLSRDNFSNGYQVSNEVRDTHARNCPIRKGTHLPDPDQTCSALMEDPDQRGLLDETLVVLRGEMGRTPKVNDKGGRDHGTFCYPVTSFSDNRPQSPTGFAGKRLPTRTPTRPEVGSFSSLSLGKAVGRPGRRPYNRAVSWARCRAVPSFGASTGE